MTPFRSVTGAAAPLLEDDINTDQIAPAGGGHSLEPDHAATLFRNRRLDDSGGENPDFVLNRPRFRAARILVTGRNFGCGSSRETAVWSVAAFGIRCVIARSFADIYRENCLKNGVLPVVLGAEDGAALEALVLADDGRGAFTADLEAQRIVAPDGTVFAFDMPEADRAMLLDGLDDIGLTERHESDIARWEAETALQRPWLQTLREAGAS